jgi:GT2 family glycosyltransferase
MINLSVSAVSGKSEKNLENCLASLRKTKGDFKINMIVTDNLSEWDLEKCVRKFFPDAELIRNTEKHGFAFNHNQALLRQKNDYAIVINDDIEFQENTIEELVKCAGREKNGAVFGPLIHPGNWDGSPILPGSALNELWPKAFYGIAALFLKLFSFPTLLKFLVKYKHRRNEALTEDKKLSYISGACCLITRDFIEKYGLYDPAYFMYYEDIDLGKKVRDAGYECLVSANAAIMHIEGATSSPKTFSFMAKGISLYAKKHHGWTIRIIVNILLPLLSAANKIKSKLSE